VPQARLCQGEPIYLPFVELDLNRSSQIYLNPNGLKYHLTKGTCDLDGTKPSFDKGIAEPED
jgi:hypothetical protein